MSGYKNLEDIKKEFSKRIAEHETLLEAWEKVERVTKKDGSNFAALGKNFKNAKIRENQYSIRPDKLLTVYGWTSDNRYIEEDINTTDHADRYNGRAIDPERIIKESYITPYYIKTVDELFEDIEAKKEYHKKAIEGYKKQINESQFYYDQIAGKMIEIHNVLNSMCKKGKPSTEFLSLRYALEDVVKNYYFR